MMDLPAVEKREICCSQPDAKILIDHGAQNAKPSDRIVL
jgi:hypothetical protein